MTPDPVTDTLRSALEALVAANVPALDSEAEGCPCDLCAAIRAARAALAATPAEPEYEWRAALRRGESIVYSPAPTSRVAAERWLGYLVGGWVERRIKAGAWERVD